MAETTADEATLRRIGELARATLRSQADLARQSAELTRAAVTGELDRSSAGRAYLDAVSREGARYWRSVAELGIDYASGVVTLGTAVASSVLTDTQRAGGVRHRPQRSHDTQHDGHRHTDHDGQHDGHRHTDHDADDRRRADGDAAGASATATHPQVVLRGAVGERATGTVTVANRHPRARRVELAASDLLDEAGFVIATPLLLDPDRVTIPAGEEHVIGLTVVLDAASVTAGGRYTGELRVSGGDEATLDVLVEVDD